MGRRLRRLVLYPICGLVLGGCVRRGGRAHSVGSDRRLAGDRLGEPHHGGDRRSVVNSSLRRAVLVALLIFLCGAGVGSAVTVWVGGRQIRRELAGAAEPRGRGDRAVERIGREISKELELTPAEAERVQAILGETAVNLRRLRADTMRQGLVELRGASRRISAELPPEKRDDFQRLLRKRFQRLGIQNQAD
jgi:hypothetical protein